jgi:DNA polymerase III, delta subunit (EC 2.7.7.7)
MKIKPEQLDFQLAHKLESIYFVFGAEILLIEQSLTQIRKAAKKQTLTTGSVSKSMVI